jgi:hypothetical protein
VGVSVLDRERRFYEERRAELLAAIPGLWVLIKGAEVLGAFGTEDEGVAAGVRLLGPDEPFFVQRVETEEEEIGAVPRLHRFPR